MSLKTFHIIFVLISIFLMVGISYWSYSYWSYYQDNYYLGFLIFSILGLILLCVYGNKFINRYKSLL